MEKEVKPYSAEYAKSNRASCKGCKSLISKDTLRLAHMVKSPFYDGLQPHWFHFTCFFRKFRPTSTDDIENFYNLRNPDQEKIQEQVEKPKGGGTGSVNALKDFVVQYALSNRSACRSCEDKIEKNEIRISHKEVHPDKPQLGLVDRWFHVGCFKKNRKELGWQDEFSANMMTGFMAIDANDRKTLTDLFKPKGKKKSSKVKAASSNIENTDPEKEAHMKKFKKQGKDIWKLIDKLKAENLTKNELCEILNYNDQPCPTGKDKLYEVLADGMMFGQLPTCTICNNGKFRVSRSGVYECRGNLSEWSRCTNTVREVKRTPWKIPPEFNETPLLANYKYQKRQRILPPRTEFKPLNHMKVLTLCKCKSRSKDELKAEIIKLGGTVTSSVNAAYFAIANEEFVNKDSKKLNSIRNANLFVVSEDILNHLAGLQEKEAMKPTLEKFRLTDWGEEHTDRGEALAKVSKRKASMLSGEGDSKRAKMLLKNGTAVDPETGLDEFASVLCEGSLKYTVTLAMVNSAEDLNSFYKMQLLKHDGQKIYHVWRAWGRVGTRVGGTKLERFGSKQSAIENFETVYFEKTGNEFGCGSFVKHPHKFYPMDIDYGENDEKLKQLANLQSAGKNSKLQIPLQNLMKLIFDIESMKKAMVEFELDLQKMPLGKLSKKQMQEAYSVLNQVNQILNLEDAKARRMKMMDFTNRFYTLLPHDFGMKQPPLLDNAEIIKTKADMLDNLMDIEIAYELLTTETKEEINVKEEVDPLDHNYEKLKCKLEPLDRSSDEFLLIQEYVKNTHAPTHSDYTLEIEDIFTVERHGEAQRYRTFKKLPNRQLLWHGSRVTNFAGILSLGLRIAPPEAPSTGYMFGKGIYFADMVSKSTNYCYASRHNPFGLALLSEVALGNMHELKDAQMIRKLPSGKHSVKGLGATIPNPDEAKTLPDGTIVPLGKPVPIDIEGASLLYNEFIVYDVAQVNVKYLLKLKFNYESLW